MKKVLILLISGVHLVSAQKHVEPDKMKQFNIIVNQDEQIVKTQILKNPKKVHLNNDATYLWYTANQLVETKGGYDGKLVHGYYKSFFFTNQLKESGEIRYGLKSKKWRYWYSNGLLREVITWKHGRKNGAYAIYNDLGKLMAKGNFKDDQLHGRFYTYDTYGNVSEKKKYRHGEEVIKAPRIKKEKQPKPLKEKKAKRKKEPVADQPAETTPQQDSTRKENLFHKFFKRKKKEVKPETTSTTATA